MIKYTEYKYHLAALFTVTVWGATFVSTKVLIANSLTPAEIFLLRFAMAYVCILPFARGRMWAANLRDELLLAAAGLSGGSLYFLTENMALEYAPASNVSLIVCTAPVWTAVVMSLFYRGERMSRRQIAGSALAFAGMVLVVLNGHFVLRLSPRGDMLALSAAMLWMVYSLVIKRLGGRYPAIFITRKVFFYGLVTILPVFAFRPFGADWEGRTHRDRPLGHVEQPAAHAHRHDRKGQKKKMVTRAEVRKFEPQRPPHLEKSCQNQIQPSHRKRFLRTKIANFTSRAK